MKLIDFAKAKANQLHRRRGTPRGSFMSDAAKTGDHVLIRWENGEHHLHVLLTIEEAEDFRKDLALSIFRAQHLHRKVHGLITLGWCNPKGRAISDDRAQARIVKRFDETVLIEVINGSEPPSKHGRPMSGMYWLDGWREGHDRIQQGWRIISNLSLENRRQGPARR